MAYQRSSYTKQTPPTPKQPPTVPLACTKGP